MPGFACIWVTPFGSCQLLAPLVPGGSTIPRAITADGATVVGAAENGSGQWKAVKWNTATLAVTQLADILPSSSTTAIAISADGTTIIGGGPTSFGGAIGSDGDVIAGYPQIRWTSGGTTGAPLYDQSGSTDVFNQWGVGPVVRMRVSDNGSVNVGIAAAPDNTGSKWVNGAVVSVPGISGPVTNSPSADCVSQDGSLIAGATNTTGTDVGDACYWTGTTLRRLAESAPPSSNYCIVYFANSAASVLWGMTTGGLCYWDSLTTPAGDGVHYGVCHVLSQSGTTKVQWVADDALVAVGQNGPGAARWNGTAVTQLGAIGGSGNFSIAYGCNHDGSLAVGYSYDTAGVQWPVYWDAGNTLHVLPTLASLSDYFQGEAFGINRNGTVIFGLTDVGSEPPPITETLIDAELFFTPTAGFIDFANAANRRLFVSAGNGAEFLGTDGARPFGTAPSVYLTAVTGNPNAFAQNNGMAGPFAINGGIDAFTPAPGCTPYVVPEAAGPAAAPQWRLTVSDDGGRTWSTLVKPRDIGETGKYRTRLRWLKMGQFRQRTVRLECSDPVRRNIVGIYEDNTPGMS